MSNELMNIDEKVFNGSFTTIECRDKQSAAKVYNAATGKCESLRENVNKVIAMQHIYIEKVLMKVRDEKGDETGEVQEANRTVIISSDGKNYSTCSKGVYSALKRIISIFGMPEDWENGVLEIIPVIISTGKGQVLSLKVRE